MNDYFILNKEIKRKYIYKNKNALWLTKEINSLNLLKDIYYDKNTDLKFTMFLIRKNIMLNTFTRITRVFNDYFLIQAETNKNITYYTCSIELTKQILLCGSNTIHKHYDLFRFFIKNNYPKQNIEQISDNQIENILMYCKYSYVNLDLLLKLGLDLKSINNENNLNLVQI